MWLLKFISSHIFVQETLFSRTYTLAGAALIWPSTHMYLLIGQQVKVYVFLSKKFSPIWLKPDVKLKQIIIDIVVYTLDIIKPLIAPDFVWIHDYF